MLACCSCSREYSQQQSIASIFIQTESWSIGLSLDRYCWRLSVTREVWTFSLFKSIDIEVSGKTAMKVSSIRLPIPRHESLVDTDIDTTQVSSIVSMSISTFDINDPGCWVASTIQRRQHTKTRDCVTVLSHPGDRNFRSAGCHQQNDVAEIHVSLLTQAGRQYPAEKDRI